MRLNIKKHYHAHTRKLAQQSHMQWNKKTLRTIITFVLV